MTEQEQAEFARGRFIEGGLFIAEQLEKFGDYDTKLYFRSRPIQEYIAHEATRRFMPEERILRGIRYRLNGTRLEYREPIGSQWQPQDVFNDPEIVIAYAELLQEARKPV